MRIISYFKQLLSQKRAKRKLKNKYKGSRIIMYKNGFAPMETDDVRHPYSALYATGWRTRHQLENSKNPVQLTFVDTNRKQGGMNTIISLCWFKDAGRGLVIN